MEHEFVICDCYEHAVSITNDEGLLYFAMWEAYPHAWDSSKLTWKERFRILWRLIRGKQIYADQMILNQNQAKKFVEILNRQIIKAEQYKEKHTSTEKLVEILNKIRDNDKNNKEKENE